MIWESITLMTVIDVFIVMVTLAALRILYTHRRVLVEANLLRSASLMVVGLLVIGLFYLGDLFTMWVLPSFVARARAMEMMTDLHLNYSWITMLVGTLSIFAGFAYTIRGLLATASDLQKKTDQLEAFNRDMSIEITERKQTEEALRESEARYRAFVSNSYVGIWHTEARPPLPLDRSIDEQIDWIYEHVYFTDCNDAAARIYGFDEAEDLIGKRVGEVLPRDHEANEAVVRRIVESGYDLVDDEWSEVNAAGQTVLTFNSLVSTIEDGYVIEGWGVLIDITERKRAEEALRKNEARLAEAQRIAHLGHWEWDLTTNVQYWSDELYRIYGLAPQTAEVSYQTFLDLVHPDDRAHVKETTDALLAGHHEGSLEFRIVRPDGKIRTIWGEATLFADEEDTPIRVAGTTLDITERKQVEEALRESEARYRSLYNNTPVMLHSTDAEGLLLSVSDYWLDMLGYTRDEVLGRPATQFLTDAARHYAETVCMPAFRKTGILKEEPLQLQKKNGEVIDILLSAINERNTEDAVERSLAVSVDVTERNRAEKALRVSEEKFATAFRSGPDAVMITSLEDGRLVEVNNSFLNATGYRHDEVIGRTALDLALWADPEDRDRMVALLQSQGEIRDLETRFRMKSGDVRIGHLSAGLIELDGQRCLLSVTRDITERKQAEEALREYADRLKILRENDRAILAAQAPEVIAEVGLQHVHQLVPCTYANVVIFDEETRDVQLMAFHPDVAEPRRRTMKDLAGVLDLDRLGRGQVHRVPDISELPQTNPLTHLVKVLGLESFLSVPLMAQGHLIGLMNIGFDRPVAYTEQHVEIANEAADSLAVAIEHARLFGQVQEANTRLHSLSRQLVQAQEAERRTLARELHDQIGQTLTAVKHSLQAVRNETSNDLDLDEHIQTVGHALDQVRTLSLDLRPSMLDDLGLVPALRWYVDRQARQAGFEGQVIANEQIERLPSELEVTCFRVAQEALTNIARHAQARRVHVTLLRDEAELALIIKDDGQGFDVEHALERAAAGTSMGLLGMEERVHLAGGRLTIHSQKGKGTEVRARFSVQA